MESEIASFTAVGTDTDERFYFIAAALTLGFELAEGTPQVSNVYSVDKRFEPGEFGDVRMYLDIQKGGLSINHLVETWINPDHALKESETIIGLILTADNSGKLMGAIQSFDFLYTQAAVASMRKYSLRRISVPDPHNVNDLERVSITALDKFSEELEGATDKKGREKAAKVVAANWNPAMVAWVKAWIANYLEIKNLWKDAPAAIKIKRNGLPPLVIPKGPKFKEMLQRWT